MKLEGNLDELVSNLPQVLKEQAQTLNEQEKAILLVRNNPLDILQIPEKYITIEMYEYAVDTNPNILNEYCSSKFITPKNVVKFVNYNPLCIRYVRKEFVTPELAMFAVKKNVDVIPYIPDEALTDDLITYVLNIDGKYLINIPKERRSREFCELAFSKNQRILRSIPTKFKNYDMCKKAVISYPKSIKYVPVTFLTEQFMSEIYLSGVEIPYECIRYVKTCLNINNKKEKVNSEQHNIQDNKKINENVISEEVRNIEIKAIPYYFSDSDLRAIYNCGIVTLGQLFDRCENTTLCDFNTMRLLRCKYLNDNPLIDINDENLDSQELYTLLGFSSRTCNTLLRINFANNAKEFFSKIKDDDIYKKITHVSLIGSKTAAEIIEKANIIIEYYEKKQKNNSNLLMSEDEILNDSYDEMLEKLTSELQKLREENKKIDEQIDFILAKMAKIQERKMEQSKGGTLK